MEPKILAPVRESATVLRASQAGSEGGLPSVAGRPKRDEIQRLRRRSNIILAGRHSSVVSRIIVAIDKS